MIGKGFLLTQCFNSSSPQPRNFENCHLSTLGNHTRQGQVGFKFVLQLSSHKYSLVNRCCLAWEEIQDLIFISHDGVFKL